MRYFIVNSGVWRTQVAVPGVFFLSSNLKLTIIRLENLSKPALFISSRKPVYVN